MVEGNTQHRYKEAIALIEEHSPGTKHQMYFGFLKRAASRFEGDAAASGLVACISCGAPTLDPAEGEPRCSFCRTKALAERRAQGIADPRIAGKVER